jgi:outer membrane lipopolysaccharide assembly protein LptE/RlpB
LGGLCRLFVLAALIALTACGYRFTGSGGTRLAAGQTMWVSFVDSPSSQIVVRRALLEEAHALRGISAAGSAAEADLRVIGSVKGYSIKAMSYNPLDEVKEYRLSIDVELELTRRGESVPLWKGTIKSFQDYPANVNLALQRNAEQAALSAASHIMAQKFLTAVEQAY